MTELEQIIKRSEDDGLNKLKSAMFTLLLREFFTAAELPFKHISVYDRLKECISILYKQEYEQWRENITGSRKKEKKERTEKLANRRMFSLDVIDTDRFLDMPATTQALYFHLGMRADDDGFVSLPKRISNYVGCNEDDIKLLIAKGFIIAFESGVIVITDWKVNNSIRNDRYNKTKYIDELNILNCENGAYTITDNVGIPNDNQMATNGIPNDNQMTYQRYPQVRLGKVSIGKDNIINYQKIVNMYNDTCVSFPKVQSISDNRKKAIKARLKQYSIEDFKRLFEMAEQSDFLKGANNRNWSANFDWLIKDANMAKVLDGNYQNRHQEVAPAQPEQEIPQLTEEQQELYRQVAKEQVNRMWGDE